MRILFFGRPNGDPRFEPGLFYYVIFTSICFVVNSTAALAKTTSPASCAPPAHARFPPRLSFLRLTETTDALKGCAGKNRHTCHVGLKHPRIFSSPCPCFLLLFTRECELGDDFGSGGPLLPRIGSHPALCNLFATTYNKLYTIIMATQDGGY